MIRAEVVQTSARVNPAKTVVAAGLSLTTREDCSRQISSVKRPLRNRGATFGRLIIMAWYKYKEFLHQFTGNGDAYDALHDPGEATPFSGVYRCESCGVEIVSEYQKPMPPTHANAARGHAIQWRLVAYADHKKPNT